MADSATNILGVRVSAVDEKMALAVISQSVETGAGGYVCVTGVHGVMESQADPMLSDIHNASLLTVPDGMPLVWLSHAAGAGWVRRVYGPDLMLATLALASEKGWSSYFYGGGTGVPQTLAQCMQTRFPGLAVAGAHSPPFRPLTVQEDYEVVENIRNSGCKLLWIGLSTPKQERWMAAHAGLLPGIVLLGVGAAFDFHTGGLRQAPRFIQRLGLEWAFRLAVEPRRLWRRYLKTIPGSYGQCYSGGHSSKLGRKGGPMTEPPLEMPKHPSLDQSEAAQLRTKLAVRVPAGVLDSGLSSLATFITGYLAVRYLNASVLGAYALALTAFLMAGGLVSTLLFTGVETDAIRLLPAHERTSVLVKSLRMAAGFAALAGVTIAGATLFVPSRVAFSDRMSLAIACACVAFISPMQDHARRLQHAALESWGAATTSIVQVVSVFALSVVAFRAGIVRQPWTAFAILASANTLSLATVVYRVRRSPLAIQMPVGIWRSMRFGRELGFASALTFGSAFAATALVIARSDSGAAGQAEGARLLAQPITLVSIGMLSVLTPDLISAVVQADNARLRKLVSLFLLMMTVLAIGWGVFAWRPWSWSPLPSLSPNAYTLPGLVLLTVPAQVIGYAALFGLPIAQAVGSLRRFAILQTATSLIGLVVAGALARHGAWALAISSLASGASMMILSLVFFLGRPRGSILVKKM